MKCCSERISQTHKIHSEIKLMAHRSCTLQYTKNDVNYRCITEREDKKYSSMFLRQFCTCLDWSTIIKTNKEKKKWNIFVGIIKYLMKKYFQNLLHSVLC